MPDVVRGDVWFADLEPVRGHEQGGRRPVLVISSDRLNKSPALLAIVLPMTSIRKGIPSHIPIEPPEGGVSRTTYIKCEDVRCISADRLERRWGSVSPATLAVVSERLRWLMEL